MEQRELPGFPANERKAAKFRQRRTAKGLEAVLGLVRCLEKLLGADPPGSDLQPVELGARPRRRRGRPKVEKTVEAVAPAAEADRPMSPQPPAATAEPIPKPVTKRDLAQKVSDKVGAAVDQFISEMCIPADGATTGATTLYLAFKKWLELTGRRPGRRTTTQRAFGQKFSQRFRREKHGTYVYYGVVISSPGRSEILGAGPEIAQSLPDRLTSKLQMPCMDKVGSS